MCVLSEINHRMEKSNRWRIEKSTVATVDAGSTFIMEVYFWIIIMFFKHQIRITHYMAYRNRYNGS